MRNFSGADFQQRALDAVGNTISRMKKAGVCDHGSLQGNKNDDSQICRQCGETFPSFDAAVKANADAIRNFSEG